MVIATEPNFSDDDLVANFIQELENTVDIQGLVEEYALRSPQMETELWGIVEMRRNLDECQPQVARPSIPDRLGEFEIIRRIDHGGMGEIYEARQRRLNRNVALKVIRPGWSSMEAKLRFTREQRILAGLHHTNILPIYAAGLDGGTHYFTMPYVDGVPMSWIVGNLRQSTRNGWSRRSSSLPDLASQLLRPMCVSDAIPRKSGNIVPEDSMGDWTVTRKYLESVATIIATIAEAIDAAHQLGILHRDLKPSNIMIQPDGHVWVIDFGLATHLASPQMKTPNVSPDASNPVEKRTSEAGFSPDFACAQSFHTDGIGGGTPNYMAPERWLAKPVDARTDVFSLGAILFEFLTLRRAFSGKTTEEIRTRIVSGDVAQPGEIARHLPEDLSAICVKALRKNPDSRYATARDLADDLRRWVNYEPVAARPATVHRSAYLWCRRKPGWASTLVVLFTLCLGALCVAYADAAESRRKRTREGILGDIEQLNNGTHKAGWFKEVEAKSRELLELKADADVVRDTLTASLRGYDAELVSERVLDHGAVYLAFDGEGMRLLASGTDDENSRPRSSPSVLDIKTNNWQDSPLKGAGPVSFLPDGTPVTLLVDQDDFRHARLHDVVTGAVLREFTLGVDKTPAKVDGYNSPRLALNPDGSLAAMCELAENGKGTINVWNSATGDRLLELIADSPSKLAFSPDGLLLAVGSISGDIRVIAVEEGSTLRKLRMGSGEITMLAFGKDYLRRQDKPEAPSLLDGWLIAAGNSQGRIQISELDSGDVRSRPLGSRWEVRDAAFSRDGNMLVSIARLHATLWDVASGRPLLQLPWGRSIMPGVAISPDDQLIAMSAVPIYEEHKGVRVWKLNDGRGSTEFHGLTNSITQVAVSRNEKLVAALTHDFQIGVWDLDARRLLHVFEAPGRVFADNSAIALNKDGSILACATESVGILWDTKTGREIRRWDKLAPALVNEMEFFDDDNRLLLFRAEVKDRSRLPDSRANPDTFPRVGRVYNLLADSSNPVLEIEDFPERIRGASISGSFGMLAVNGRRVRGAPDSALLFDLRDAGGLPRIFGDNFLGTLIADGRILLLSHPTGDPTCEIRESQTGVLLATSIHGPEDIDFKHGYRILQTTSDNDRNLYDLIYDKAGRSVARVPHDQSGSKGIFLYRGENPRLVIPMQSGELVITEIEELREKLNSFALGW